MRAGDELCVYDLEDSKITIESKETVQKARIIKDFLKGKTKLLREFDLDGIYKVNGGSITKID